MVLGGRGAGQFGQLAISGQAALSGSLNVTLGNGFSPVAGDQFPVLTSAGLSGAFDSVSVPAGAFLYYTNGTVLLAFTGQPNLPPSVQFVLVSPTNGPVPSGSAFEVDALGSGNDGISRMTASVSGVVSNALSTNGNVLRIQGVVPPTAVAGQTVQVVAQAFDNIGQASSAQGLTLSVSDGTPPALVLLGPAANSLLPVGQGLSLSALVSDNSTNVTLNLAVFGSLAATQSVALPLVPNAAVTNGFSVPADPTRPGACSRRC